MPKELPRLSQPNGKKLKLIKLRLFCRKPRKN